MHRRAHTLHSEIRAAERALPKRTMRPISRAARGQTQLSSAEGAEADLDNGHGEPAPWDQEQELSAGTMPFRQGAAAAGEP